MVALAQDGASSLLPDWLADAPPWLQLIALLLAAAVVLGALTIPVWGSAVADRIRGRTSAPATASTEVPAGSTTSPPAPVERYDQKMAVIERMLANLEKEQERDRADAEYLRGRVRQLEDSVRSKDELIAQLRLTIDQLVSRPRGRAGPWSESPTDPGLGSTSGR